MMLAFGCYRPAYAEIKNKPTYYDFHIPKMDVASALNKLSAKTKKPILFPFDEASTRQASFVVGKYTLEQALEILLHDSGYSGQLLNNGTIKISKTEISEPALLADTQTENDDLSVKAIAPPIPEDAVEIIQVSGFSNSIKRSLNYKRYSYNIVDSVFNEDLGEFPEQNIAEALQRITGISVDRESGEGQFLTVRGFGPEFNTILYNDRVLPTENSGREFSFDVLSEDLISSASVYKTTSATIATGGIGSTVNMSSLKPMDYEGARSYLSVSSTFNSLSQDFFPQLTTLASYSTDKFGVLASFNYQNRKYQINSANTIGWLLTDLDYVENKKGEGDFRNARIPTSLNFRVERGTRERIGSTVILQSYITDDLFVTFDYLFSKFVVDSKVSSSSNWTHYLGDSFDSVELNKNNTLMSYTYKNDFDAAADFVELSYNRPTEMNQAGLNFKWNQSENLTATLDASYALAKNKNGGNDFFVIVGSPTANPAYEYTPSQSYATVTHENPVDLNELRSHGVTFKGDDIKDGLFQLKLNARYSLGSGIFDDLTAGFYQSIRKKHKDAYQSLAGVAFEGYRYDVPEDMFKEVDTTDFLDSQSSFSIYSFDIPEYIDYLEQLTGFTGLKADYRPTDSWEVVEDIKEAFINFDVSGTINQYTWMGNFGLRYANTDITSTGYPQFITDIQYNENDQTNLTLAFSEPETEVHKHQYSYLLPSFNIKLDLDKEQVLRLAMSKTITRPNLNDLPASLGQYHARVEASTARRGNAYLKPYESVNFDMGWSWYYKADNFIGFEFFYKNLAQYITEVTDLEVLYPHPEGEFLVTNVQNTNDASVQGIEWAMLYHFTEEVPILNGFGVQANYTLVDSRNDYHPVSSPKAFALEGLSDSYNVILFYNQDALQWRLSYNYRDQFLRKAKGSQAQPEMVEAYGQLDANLSYKLNNNVTLFLEATNVLKQRSRTFSVYKERLLAYEDNGARFSLGVKFDFGG